MKTFAKLIEKVMFEIPIFLILAVKLPFEQLKDYGISYFVLSITVALLLGRLLRRAEASQKTFYLFFTAFLLAGDMMKSVFMPSATFSYILFCKMASFLCFLLAVLIIRKPVAFLQRLFVYRFIPFICTIGILLSPSFSLFFIPTVLLLIAFENYKVKKTGFDFVFLSTLFVSLFISTIFIAIGFAGNNKFMGIVPIDFAFKILAWGEILKTFAAVFPLIVIFSILWYHAYKSTFDKRLKRIIICSFLEPFFILLSNIFIYYAASDGWKFYIFMAVFTQFCLLFYFFDSREKAVADAVEKVVGFLKKNLLILLAVMIYLIKFADVFYNR